MHSGLQGLVVKSLARRARMSRAAFAFEVRTRFGPDDSRRPTQWPGCYQAGAMIRSNNMSFPEVAQPLGYGSASSSVAFLARDGEAPGNIDAVRVLQSSKRCEAVRSATTGLSQVKFGVGSNLALAIDPTGLRLLGKQTGASRLAYPYGIHSDAHSHGHFRCRVFRLQAPSLPCSCFARLTRNNRPFRGES